MSDSDKPDIEPVTDTPAPVKDDTPPPAPPRSVSVGPDLSGVVDKLTALPEQLVNAFREAAVPAKPVETPKPAESIEPTAESVKVDPEPAKARSFSDWWYGK